MVAEAATPSLESQGTSVVHPSAVTVVGRESKRSPVTAERRAAEKRPSIAGRQCLERTFSVPSGVPERLFGVAALESHFEDPLKPRLKVGRDTADNR
jgi:hypothetical protein